jgi:uncharacterized protein
MTGPAKKPADLPRTMVRRSEPGQSRSGAPALESCGDFEIRIGADGTWYYHNSPIGRLPLVKLFASVLRREEDGSYWLVTPVERGLIVVDDAPFTAVEVDASGSGDAQELRFRTNLDDLVTADADHPIRVEIDPDTGEPRPYVHVRDGLEARILRPVYYQIVELGEFRQGGNGDTFGVWSGGQYFILGEAPAAD